MRFRRTEKLKTLVLDSVFSPITKRVYTIVLDEFLDWFQQGACTVTSSVTDHLADDGWNISHSPTTDAFLEIK